jgi:uncharacterized Zn-binding protein involved in type VI secretion
MLAIARANGTDSVLSPDGTGRKCAQPMTVSTGVATQSRVFANGILVAVIGDIVQPHPLAGCALDVQPLSSASTRVFVSGKGLARIGDKYGNNTITSGSSKCFSN